MIRRGYRAIARRACCRPMMRLLCTSSWPLSVALLALLAGCGPPSPQDIEERQDEYYALVQQHNDDWDMGALMPAACRQTATQARARNDALDNAISYAFDAQDWQLLHDLWGTKIDLLVQVDRHMKQGCPSDLPGTAIPLAIPTPQVYYRPVLPTPRATPTPVAVRPSGTPVWARTSTPAPRAIRTPLPPIEIQITITMPERPTPPPPLVPTLVPPTPVLLTPELPTREPVAPEALEAGLTH